MVTLVSSSENPSRSFLLSSRIILLSNHFLLPLNYRTLKYLSSTSIVPLPPHSPRNLSLSSSINLIFLSVAATTPHEFLITGDFSLHVDNPADNQISQFLAVLFSFNLTQHVDFPTHIKNHTLDLVISFVDSSLTPFLSTTHCSPSDHLPILTRLSVSLTPLPPPTLHSFRRVHSIDIDSFVSDQQSSPLITNQPTSLGPFIVLYNESLSSLLDKKG